MTIRDGWRASSSNAFLRPALQRIKLVLKTHAHVTKVLIEDKKAIGIECLIDGAKQTFTARKEVILSGGAIN